MRQFVCAIIAALTLTACDRHDQSREAIDLGDKRTKLGAFREAIRAYESALDGTAKTAEVHFKIAQLYDDKLTSPLAAVHHYGRYLELAPAGGRVKEAKAAMTECEKRLNASMKAGGFMTTAEGARLRNENEELRKANTELLRSRPPPAPRSVTPGAPDLEIPGSSKHLVTKGETLASIALKYYHNRAQASRIKEANLNQLGGKDIIKPGMTLIIPAPPKKKK